LLIHLQQTLIHLQLISFNTLWSKEQIKFIFILLYALSIAACLDAAALSAISFALSAPSFLSELMLTNCSSCPTIRSWISLIPMLELVFSSASLLLPSALILRLATSNACLAIANSAFNCCFSTPPKSLLACVLCIIDKLSSSLICLNFQLLLII
jgi:hypothetical protein